jgi:hypothetical protein
VLAVPCKPSHQRVFRVSATAHAHDRNVLANAQVSEPAQGQGRSGDH